MKHSFPALAVALAAIFFVSPSARGHYQRRQAARESAAERTARREIQARIDASIKADRRKDLSARMEQLAPDFSVKLLTGEVIKREQIEQGIRRFQQSTVSFGGATRTRIEGLSLDGDEATVHTNQHLVRTIRSNRGRLVERVSNIRHKEVWVKTEQGWLSKFVEESEQGPITEDGKPVYVDARGLSFVKLISEQGVQKARRVFEAARRRNPQARLFDEGTLNSAGYRFIREGRLPEAIEIFRLNVEAYPASANVYDSLAEAYMTNKRNDLAVEYYRKALERRPHNDNVMSALARLGSPVSLEESAAMLKAVVPPGVEFLPDLDYCTGGGRQLRMHLFRPQRRGDTLLPVVIFIHGGGWTEGRKERGFEALVHFARRGYAAAAVEYRLTGEARFPAQIEDVKCAVRYLRASAKRFQLNPERIGVWGQSAGGHLAALAGTSGGVKELEGAGGWPEFSSRVNAVVDWNGPTDLLEPRELERLMLQKQQRGWQTIALERLLGGDVLQNRERAADASPVTHVTPDDPPFLIMHGDADDAVSLSQSELLHKALKRASIDATLKVFKGERHFGISSSEPFRPEFSALMDAFLDAHLKPNKPGAPRTPPARSSRRTTRRVINDE